MIKLEKTSVMNMENAIRGARNPMNSWDKSDTVKCGVNVNCLDCPISVNEEGECNSKHYEMFSGEPVIIGINDLGLAKRLCKAGADHRKFMRQIFISVDITAPLYWWKEYDTYKVGTTANSCSTMHKIHSKEFVMSDFSFESDNHIASDCMIRIVGTLNVLRDIYNETKDKTYWLDMIQLLPSGYNQMRTCTMTYENLFNMYYARKNHKLEEWREFAKWIESLPYAKELICNE